MKTIRLFFIFLFLFIVLLTGNELRVPLPDSTAAFDQCLRLKKGKTIAFETDFDSGYSISMLCKDTSESLDETIGYVLTINNEQQRNCSKYSIGNVFHEIGSFAAQKGDACSLTFVTLGDKLLDKHVCLKIDVLGVGVSKDLMVEKEIRSLVSMLFWLSLFSFMLLVAFPYVKKLIRNS